MSEAQKVIKYIAIAFAIFLSINIIGGIVGATFLGLSILGVVQEQNKGEVTPMEEMQLQQELEDIKNLKLEIGYSTVIIEKGQEWKVEASNKNKTWEVKKVSDTLKIKDNKVWRLHYQEYDKPEIRITIPEDQFLEKIKIEAGSGEVRISDLQANYFDFEVGAGNVIISNLMVEHRTNIDGGAGKVVIQNSKLNNLDLDVGVGEFEIQNTTLLGENDIDAGIGKLGITLTGSLQDYRILPKRGLGSFTIDNKEIEDNTKYGDGQNKVEIDAGVGKVSVDFQE